MPSKRAGWCTSHRNLAIADCVTGEANNHNGQGSHLSIWHWVPFWMYEGTLLDLQWPLWLDMGLPHLVDHRRVDGVVQQPLCHAIEPPYHLPKTDRYNTRFTCDLYCFGILSGRQVGYLARSHFNHRQADETSPLCNISNSDVDVPDTMGWLLEMGPHIRLGRWISLVLILGCTYYIA